jgi:thiamine kinase-like enzyme
MDTSLQPESAIDSWREWTVALRSRPVILSELSGGRSNHSFLLDSDGHRMVLRINGRDSLIPGASRSNEIKIWQAAGNKGIAPPLAYVDDRNRFLVSGYISNDLPPQPQLNGAFLDQAFDLLDRCHRLDINTPGIDYNRHIEHYWHIIETGNQPPDPALRKQRKPMQSLLESLINSNTPSGLCHHDPVIENFVGTPERLYLIDWEYAANGLLIMDYAALATAWQIDDETVLARTTFKPESLTSAKTLYGYLCSLWEEVS